ncbi:MAG TPA: sigma 54-interacting transcriptional regulator [Anaeromyxobacteraceae bacterium]|nr:sigma 54-interacting transcriptional regulator [Anaeromyxobacteraceae bacterium]
MNAAALIAPISAPATALVHAASSPIVELARACTRIAASDATVLITGETGVGKEVFARLVHERSARAGKPIVAVNCGAIPEALLESELFGHVKGAFTGALAPRRGRIAAACGGTLFLDEIGELPLQLQVKLLRVLQERSYEPVGATEPVPADFRLVVATNRDLAAEVEAGRFRRDLYYRLLVCPVEVPPLRARSGDVAELFAHFWSSRGETRGVAPAAMHALESYAWPGNVRELENLVERLSVCCESSVIRVADLPPHVRGAAVDPIAPAPVAPELPVSEVRPMLRSAPPAPEPIAIDEAHPVDLPDMLRRIEEAYIDAALARTGGNKKAAADLLGLQRTTLVEKLRRRGREAAAA